MKGINDLVDSVANATGMSKAKARDAIDATFGAISKFTQEDVEGFRIHGFGTFKVVERAARAGRDPSTGEEIQIPASKVLKFKPTTKSKAGA